MKRITLILLSMLLFITIMSTGALAVDVNAGAVYNASNIRYIAAKAFTVDTISNNTDDFQVNNVVLTKKSTLNQTLNFSGSTNVFIFTNTNITLPDFNWSNLTTVNSFFNRSSTSAVYNDLSQFNATVNGTVYLFQYNAAADPKINTLPVTTISDLEYSYDSTALSLEINCSGTGNIQLTNMEVLEGAQGYYNIFLNDVLQTRSTSNTYTISSCGNWLFVQTDASALITGTTRTIITAIMILVPVVIIAALGVAAATGAISSGFIIAILVSTIIALIILTVLRGFIL